MKTNYRSLYLLNGVTVLLTIVSAGMLVFSLLQIVKNYRIYSEQNAVNKEMRLNAIINSYIQINSKEDNLYIESDTVSVYDNEVIFQNNILNSNFGNGQGKMVIYNRITKDVFLGERPKFIFKEGGSIKKP
jgi:hypothetical protein